jgi:hypothetical protein
VTARVSEQRRARPLVRYAAAPRAAWDHRYFQPLLDSEAARGNPGEWDFGDYQTAEASITFRHPIDGGAIAIEFELDDGMSLQADPARVVYDDASGEVALVACGAQWEPDATTTEARDAWWREWHAKPRPLVRLLNPIVHPGAFPGMVASHPTLLDAIPEPLRLGRYMSPELPGLGDGWSVWPFDAPTGSGLLVIAPIWFDDATARAAVDDAGGTELPVLLVIRDREPPPVTDALRDAQAEAKYLL